VLRLRARYQHETVVLVSVQFREPIAVLSQVMLRPVVAQCEMDEHSPLLFPDPLLEIPYSVVAVAVCCLSAPPESPLHSQGPVELT
jgi:hypothetical protein